MKNCASIQFIVLAFYVFCNTGMTDSSTQVFNRNVPTQESNYTAYEELDYISAIIIVSNSSSRTCDDDQLLNESVTVENVLSQERSNTAYEQLNNMSSALVIVSDCTSETYDEDQLLNESVTVENVSVNLEQEFCIKKPIY